MSQDTSGRYLLCRIGQQLCGIELTHVAETLRPLSVEPVVGAPEGVVGLAVHRGAPVPVVDGARLLGVDALDAKRFVSLTLGCRRALLAVQEVIGVRVVETASSMPPLFRGASSERVAEMGMLDSELLLVLHGARLFPDAARAALDEAIETAASEERAT